ncbi:MAG: hypothetical protein KatS3mg040_0532 [Candidatus Kapaibacterium sp.]|nr:MAG: hypothetical protein KatS3mg040_0532 [Candidatus Kapabacteria bacterium]
MKTTLALIVALALSAAAQAPVVKKGSTPQPAEQHTTEQAVPTVKKGRSQGQQSEQAAPVVKKSTAGQDKVAPAKKKKSKKKRSAKQSQP